MSAVVVQVGRVQLAVRLYDGLGAEDSASETILQAGLQGVSAVEAGKLLGLDLQARERAGRSSVDSALAAGAGPMLGGKIAELTAVRAQIDAGSGTATGVRHSFDDVIAVADAALVAQLNRLTQMSDSTSGSAELRGAIAGLRDTANAYIDHGAATNAAGALAVPGLPGGATAAVDLATNNVLYLQATSALTGELGPQGKAAWERLIVSDPDVKAFQQYVDSVLNGLPRTPPPASLAELATTFRTGLVTADHWREVADAAAADVVAMANGLRLSAQRGLERYALALGLIAILSLAVAAATTRTIVRPLRRLAARAAEVTAGDIDHRPLDPGGPYEVAMVTRAFNEIVANLQAVDQSTAALAAGDLDDPALARQVPGRIGASLQHSVERLSTSIRDNEELRRSLEVDEARFRELADRSPDVIWRIAREPTPHIDYLSPAFETVTGIRADRARIDLRVIGDRLDSTSRAILADAIAGRRYPPRFDCSVRRSDGTVGVFELQVTETSTGLQGAARDVTELRAVQARLADAASRDPLTGLANRRLLDELLEQALRRADRSGNPLALAFLDLDGFKSVNDSYGHDAGDVVLREAADRLRHNLRGADVIARYGGDEFVVVYEPEAKDSLPLVAARVAEALSAPIDIGGGICVSCSATVGVADTRQIGFDAGALIAAADHAMLDVKRERRRRAGDVAVAEHGIEGRTLRPVV
jgi:diguanylate cyclase (GGDEF)-like protein/PAS domain S-box-containing protein